MEQDLPHRLRVRIQRQVVMVELQLQVAFGHYGKGQGSRE
jgi:hypothetical protein